MQRRTFLKSGLLAAGSLLDRRVRAAAEYPDSAPSFETGDRRWQAAYDRALTILAGNVQVLPRYDRPVLIEGASYAGIWQECGPHESLVYSRFRPDVARNSHTVFFALQKPDGQLPADNKRTETGFGQIQMVVPIAATAWELARATGDEELLKTAYDACSRWDAWLMKYRNTRGTGLIEGFCTYDTGMDNSPRWAGMPRQCPDKDARRCPAGPGLPRLCPDLSATVYGARVALASMAAALGKRNEADGWQEYAEQIRKLILERLYVPEDTAFCDLDAQNHFVRVRSVVLMRMCGEHVVEQKLFDELWERQIGNPKAFWAPFPFPSSALDEPTFVRPIPRNSWGGASQALTALRTGRWMDRYGRSAEHAHLMEQWCKALIEDMMFRQQLDPLTGKFTAAGQPNYSPACLVMVDFTWRLAGVREEAGEVQWNLRPGCAAAENGRFRSKLRGGTAEIRYSRKKAVLSLSGRQLAEVEGTARLVTDGEGKPRYLLGVSLQPEQVAVRLAGHPEKHYRVKPNQRVELQDS